MSHLYIHIPFCRQKCHYCDFYSIGNLRRKDDFLKALFCEFELQKDYLNNRSLKTIYIGGGTPSVLSADDLLSLFETIGKYYQFSKNTEITIECNPDDLTKPYVEALKQTPVNRISIGAQSFDNDFLAMLNRRHTAGQIRDAVKRLQDSGFQNVSLDVMFGLPQQSFAHWKEEIQHFLSLDVPHFSAYLLTIEKNTVFGRWQQRGQLQQPSTETLWDMYRYLIDEMQKNGYEHYEISNYAKPNYTSKHNTAYWQQKPYLGLGPSAHSYNGVARQWNTANLVRYIEHLMQGKQLPFEHEVLSTKNKYNDLIITALRTKKGISFSFLKSAYPEFWPVFEKALQKYTESDLLEIGENSVHLSEKGFFVSDTIFVDFMAE